MLAKVSDLPCRSLLVEELDWTKDCGAGYLFWHGARFSIICGLGCGGLLSMASIVPAGQPTFDSERGHRFRFHSWPYWPGGKIDL